MKPSTLQILVPLLESDETISRDQRDRAVVVLSGDADPEPEPPKPVEPYLTLREIGRRLGISPCSLWRWGVPGHDLGGRRRFRISEVQAYLESPAFRKRAAELKRQRQEEASGSI